MLQFQLFDDETSIPVFYTVALLWSRLDAAARRSKWVVAVKIAGVNGPLFMPIGRGDGEGDTFALSLPGNLKNKQYKNLLMNNYC